MLSWGHKPCPLAVCRSREGGGDKRRQMFATCKRQRRPACLPNKTLSQIWSQFQKYWKVTKSTLLIWSQYLDSTRQYPIVPKTTRSEVASRMKDSQIWSKDFDCSHFPATTSPFPLGEMHTEERWFIPNLTIALGNRFYTSSQLTLSTLQHLLKIDIPLKSWTLNSTEGCQIERSQRWQVTDIPDKTKQGNLKDGPWLSLPQNTNAIQCSQAALIGSRSIRWKILRHFQRGREGGAIGKMGACNHQHCQRTNPPFLF